VQPATVVRDGLPHHLQRNPCTTIGFGVPLIRVVQSRSQDLFVRVRELHQAGGQQRPGNVRGPRQEQEEQNGDGDGEETLNYVAAALDSMFSGKGGEGGAYSGKAIATL
jgi:hypothetical protein